MKKYILVLILLMFCTMANAQELDEKINVHIQVGGRTEITAIEQSTVDKLTNAGLLVKHRTSVELNQPMPAIDVMSLTIKALVAQDQFYTKTLANDLWSVQENVKLINSRTTEMESRLTIAEDTISELSTKNESLITKVDNNFWMNIGVSVVCFVVGLLIK